MRSNVKISLKYRKISAILAIVGPMFASEALAVMPLSIYFKHSYCDPAKTDVLASLPASFDAFEGVRLAPCVPSTPYPDWATNIRSFIHPATSVRYGKDGMQINHNLRLRYLNSSISYEEQMSDQDYPIKYTDQNLVDEDAFVHSTDPAVLQVIPVTNGTQLNWVSDQRMGALAPQYYQVWRRPAAGPGTWQMIKDSLNQTSYLDQPASYTPGIYCYQIKTFTSSHLTTLYSLPECAKISPTTVDPSYFISTKLEVVSRVSPTANPSGSPYQCPYFEADAHGNVIAADRSMLVTYRVVAKVHQGQKPITGVSLFPFSFYKEISVYRKDSNGAFVLDQNGNKIIDITNIPVERTGNQFWTGPGDQYVTQLDSERSPQSPHYQNPTVVQKTPFTLRQTAADTFESDQITMYVPVIGLFGSAPGFAEVKEHNNCKPTEDLVFRLEGISAGNKVLYPPAYDKSLDHLIPAPSYYQPRLGYLTSRINNRVRQREWMGYWMNPASPQWATALLDASWSAKLDGGYNGVFLDELRPLQASLASPNGIASEAQFFEFDYPFDPNDPWSPRYGITGNPGFVDPWSLALGTMMNHLHAANFGLQFIGNTLKFYNGLNSNQDANFLNTQTINVVQGLQGTASGPDGTMLENCINDGLPQTGNEWLGVINHLEIISGGGKSVICHVTPNWSVGSPEMNRIYALASTLLVTPKITYNLVFNSSPTSSPMLAKALGGASQPTPTPTPAPPVPAGKVLISFSELDISHSNSGQVNQFPEFGIDLGAPVSKRFPALAAPTPYPDDQHYSPLPLFTRQFQNGMVVVNPNRVSDGVIVPVNLVFKPSRQLYRVRLQNIDFSSGNDSSGKAIQWNAGQVITEPATIAPLTINAGEAAIFLDQPYKAPLVNPHSLLSQ